MALYTIQDALTRKTEQNHKTDYEWYVVLPDLDPTAVPFFSNFNKVDLFDSSSPFDIVDKRLNQAVGSYARAFTSRSTPSEEISHRVYTIDTPYDSYETRKNTYGSSYWYSSSHNDIGTISMRIDEMEDCKTIEYLNKWMKLQKGRGGTHNPPAYYKRRIVFYQINKHKDEIYKSTYIGYFPTEISPVSWSYDGNSVLQYNVTLTGDSVEHEKIQQNPTNILN